MGDYIDVRGYGQAKLGTCGDWRYVRYMEARELMRRAVSSSELSDIWRMLEHGVLVRFPWPKEDHDLMPDALAGRNREDGQNLTFAVPELEPLQHQDATVSWGSHGCGKGGPYNTNIRVPCPYSTDEWLRSPPSRPSREGWIYAHIVGEWIPGAARPSTARRYWTVFGCLYCGARFSLDQTSLVEVREFESRAGTTDYRGRVLARAAFDPRKVEVRG